MITWLKSKFVTIGLVLGAILLALAGARSVKRTASAERKMSKATDLMSTGVVRDVKKAQKFIRAADTDKLVALEAQVTVQKQLEKLSEANSDIDSIADAFNSRRVRRAR